MSGSISLQDTVSVPLRNDYSNNKTSVLVNNQLPDFVQQNYQNFVAFLKLYYQYLEQTGKLTNVLKNIPNYIDPDYVVDNNLSNFINAFSSTFLANFPQTMAVNKALLVKHIKDFYISRGSVESYEFLFRILFNEDVTVWNMSQQVLQVSAGNWYQPYVLRIFTNNLISDFEGVEITGVTSYASAVVENADYNTVGDATYTELTLSNLTKNFINGETITAPGPNGTTLTATVLGIIDAIQIVNPGSRYNVGDYVPILANVGFGANAQIATVTSGALVQIGITDGGAGYQISPNWNFTVTNSEIPANFEILTVDSSGTLWPNTYFFNDNLANTVNSTNISTISSEQISTIFPTNIPYANCGPITYVHIVNGGQFNGEPDFIVSQNVVIGNANTQIINFGTIGTLDIVNAGVGYTVNDDIVFTNLFSSGFGAAAYVSAVNANGSITQVSWELPHVSGTANVTNGSNIIIGKNTQFANTLWANDNPTLNGSGTYIVINNQVLRVSNIANNTWMNVTSNITNGNANTQKIYLNGYVLGGYGYTQDDLDTGGISISINSVSNGSNAVITGDSILGSGATFTSVGSVYGQIESFVMNSFGSEYSAYFPPTIDLSGLGDGTATAVPEILGGVFQYPGYYLNEDGFISGRRYIQSAEEYNFYSYMLRSSVAVSAYQQLIYNIIHPAGMNMIGMMVNDINLPTMGLQQGAFTYITLNYPLLDVNFILDKSEMS